MHLVQLLLPLRDNLGRSFAPALFEGVADTMTHMFGGVTAYARAPAFGSFRNARGSVTQDDMVVFEVMCETLDRAFWARYREQLKQLFAQEDLVVRATRFERL
jgi:hypothetical protein